MARQSIARDLAEESELLYDVQEFDINIDSREIWLASQPDEANEEAGVDYRMAHRFEKNLRFLTHQQFSRKKEPILVHMHTAGGIWEDGMAIYDAIKACTETPITILVYGHAESMSSIILQAADYRVMMPNSIFMIHYGYMTIDSSTTSAESRLENIKRLNELTLDIYYDRCKEGEFFKNKKEGFIKKYLDRQIKDKEDWYLFAKDAVNYGLADAVLGDKGYENIKALT